MPINSMTHTELLADDPCQSPLNTDAHADQRPTNPPSHKIKSPHWNQNTEPRPMKPNHKTHTHKIKWPRLTTTISGPPRANKGTGERREKREVREEREERREKREKRGLVIIKKKKIYIYIYIYIYIFTIQLQWAVINNSSL